MRELRRWSVLILAAGLAGCASYNAMWNAEQRAKDARRLEQQGQVSEARAQWAQAAVKAAKVSGDRALVLRIEALARSGACGELPELIAEVRGAGDRPSRERVDLAEAECAISAGDAARAAAVLVEPLKSGNADRRARAEYTAGRAAVLRQDYDAAIEHFGRAREPDAAGRAFVAEQRARIARATQRGDLKPITEELNRGLRTTSGADEAGHLVELLTAVQAVPEGPAPTRYHIAELARDSLQAPLLAGRLFLEAAASDTASLFAPKALIAALQLLPEQRDSIIALLDTQYARSPYTLAFHGEVSVAYAAAEDSLARALGGQGVTPQSAPAGVRSGGPLTGPRGPRFP